MVEHLQFKIWGPKIDVGKKYPRVPVESPPTITHSAKSQQAKQAKDVGDKENGRKTTRKRLFKESDADSDVIFVDFKAFT